MLIPFSPGADGRADYRRIGAARQDEVDGGGQDGVGSGGWGPEAPASAPVPPERRCNVGTGLRIQDIRALSSMQPAFLASLGEATATVTNPEKHRLRPAGFSLCKLCAKQWRRANPRRARGVAWSYPARVYFDGDSRLCPRHAAGRTADGARRRASELQAAPAWVQSESISGVYRLAAAINAGGGRRVEVDHIVPLRGRSVSGLHVPWNLQIIPASKNRRKGNRFEGG